MSQKIQINAHSVYAPIRYEATRPFSKSLGKLFMAHYLQGDRVRLDFLSTMQKTIRAEIRKITIHANPTILQNEFKSIQIFGIYQHGGKIIFDISKGLASSLKITDCTEIPCSEIPFPASSFYLNFGNIDNSNNSTPIQGAFISHEKERIYIDLVNKNFGLPFFSTIPKEQDSIGISIDIKNDSQSISNALDASIEHLIEKYREFSKEQAAIEHELSIKYKTEINKSNSPIETFEKDAPILREFLGLIINTLFYIAAEPSDVQYNWEQNAPKELIDKIPILQKEGARKTLENTLAKSGYTKVNFVGKKYEQSTTWKTLASLSGDTKKISTHIRRGHFRHQPHGPENSLRKIIFISPAIINKNIGSIDNFGKIYKVQ